MHSKIVPRLRAGIQDSPSQFVEACKPSTGGGHFRKFIPILGIFHGFGGLIFIEKYVGRMNKILGIFVWELMLLASGFELSPAFLCVLLDILKIIQMLLGARKVHTAVV